MVEIAKDVYRGKKEEELKNASLEEVAKLFKARARRAVLRMLAGKNVKYANLVKRVRKKIKSGEAFKKPIKTHVREAVIIPEWLGLKFLVYNGKEWKPVDITIDKIGHRLGEYNYTVKFESHSSPGIGATRGSKFVAAK
jgi:small subunit ribosomal protein S19